jgi:transcriptional regulator GlxA family with amidase domain
VVAGFPDRFRLGLAHPLVALAREATREYALRPRGWRRGLEALATRLLLGLLREFPGAPAAAPAHPALARVAPALEAMRSTLASPLSVPALARRCGLSQAQFRRLFTQVVGCSPVAHLRRLRVAEACRLLRGTGDTVERIAGMVGYAETSYFAAMFRAEMGMPPGAFRLGSGP